MHRCALLLVGRFEFVGVGFERGTTATAVQPTPTLPVRYPGVCRGWIPCTLSFSGTLRGEFLWVGTDAPPLLYVFEILRWLN